MFAVLLHWVLGLGMSFWKGFVSGLLIAGSAVFVWVGRAGWLDG